MALTLVSSAFAEGDTIPAKFTCDGEDRSPPFAWTGVPAGTESLLLVCDDPDAPGGTFHHWAAFNIPAGWTGLEEGHGPNGRTSDFAQAINDFRAWGYRGPCPPRSHKTHRYHFRLSALRGRLAPVSPEADCVEIQRLALPMEIDTAELTGCYRR
jgi:hypothetical protein